MTDVPNVFTGGGVTAESLPIGLFVSHQTLSAYCALRTGEENNVKEMMRVD